MTAERKPLHGIFSEIPPRYDLVNHIVTLGMDVRWRRLAAQACLSGNPSRIMDICCGTGDLALNIARMANGDMEITGLDFSEPMLRIAREKAGKRGLDKRISFRHGDVSALPFTDGYFDCIGISFAFRNLTYKNPLTAQYLAEILRVLRPGGRFVIVESSQPPPGIIRTLFHFYLRRFVYPMGYVVSSNKGAYRYLAESAANFYSPFELKKLLDSTGFREFRSRALFFGAAAVYTVTK